MQPLPHCNTIVHHTSSNMLITVTQFHDHLLLCFGSTYDLRVVTHNAFVITTHFGLHRLTFHHLFSYFCSSIIDFNLPIFKSGYLSEGSHSTNHVWFSRERIQIYQGDCVSYSGCCCFEK